MKDFRLDRKADRDYILDVKTRESRPTVEGQETTEELLITFADGRVFRDVQFNEESIRKIIKQQEAQAKAGVENIGVFEKRKTRAGIMTGAAIVGGPVIGALAATAIANPVTLAIGTGVLTLTAAVPAVCSLVKNSGKVSELRKIKYRDDHSTDLREFPNYRNALVGLSSRKKNWFEGMLEEGQDPFCITEIDSYSQGDLEQIVQNIETEKKYQFTYVPRKTAGARK